MVQKQKNYFLIYITLLLSLLIFDYGNPDLFLGITKSLLHALYAVIFVLSLSVYFVTDKKLYLFQALICIMGFGIIIVYGNRQQELIGFLIAAISQFIVWLAFYIVKYFSLTKNFRVFFWIAFSFHAVSTGSYFYSIEYYESLGLYLDLYYFALLIYMIYSINWNGLLEALKSQLVEITAIKEKRDIELERQLHIARQIQARYLPRGNEIKNVKIAFQYEPLWQVGGDFCSIILPGSTFISKKTKDIVELSHCGVIVGDVVGKGPAAALIMSDLIASTQMMGFGRIKPAETLEVLNDRLCDKQGTYLPYLATACYLAIDIDLEEIVIANAGHEPPLLYRNALRKVEKIEAHGIMLGVDVDVPVYEEQTIKYSENDKLILYTDGILNMLPEDTELEELVALYGDLPAKEMLESIILNLSGKRNIDMHFDDYLILILEFGSDKDDN